MAKNKLSPDQADLFFEPVYPARTGRTIIDNCRFQSEVSRALSRALNECPFDRHEVAARMASIGAEDTFNKTTLDALTSEAKITHCVSLHRFLTLTLATEQFWLMDFLAEKVGCTSLVGAEAHLAEQARLDNEIAILQAKKRTMGKVAVKRRKRK